MRLEGPVLAPGPFVLLGDHAGNAVPAALAGLGLAPSELDRHIALDIGVRELGHALSSRLDAPFLHQAYSRLVIDCNRDPADPSAIAAMSDGVSIPRNRDLAPGPRQARIGEVLSPITARSPNCSMPARRRG